MSKSLCRRLVLLACLLSLSAFSATESSAEMYVAGEGGYVMPNNLTNVEGRGTRAGVLFSDLSMNNSSYLYGGRVGYFLANPKEGGLGAEIEAYKTPLAVKEQTTTRTPGGPLSITETRLQVKTVAVNLVARTPQIWAFQPYAGVGLGFFPMETSGSAVKSSDHPAGLNAFAGLRYFFADHIALFGEYKYNRTSFHLENFFGFGAGARLTYSANLFVGGLAYHF